MPKVNFIKERLFARYKLNCTTHRGVIIEIILANQQKGIITKNGRMKQKKSKNIMQKIRRKFVFK